MDIEEAFKEVGEIGVYQRRVFWSTAIPQIFVAWIHLLNIFVGAIPDFYCHLKHPTDTKEHKILNKCSPDPVNNPCVRYSFSDQEFTSIASEWDLVCDQAYKSDLVQSVFMVGLLTGNLVGGYMADKYGRKPTCYIGSFGFLIFGILSTISTSYDFYLFLRFISGIASGIYGLISFTFPAEMVGSSYRGYVNFVTSVTFALGISSLPILAYYVRDWRFLSLYSALPGLFGIYYYYCIVESPRWLYSQGDIVQAENVLNIMYKANQPLSVPAPPPLSFSSPSSFASSLYTIMRYYFVYVGMYVYVSVFSPVPVHSDGGGGGGGNDDVGVIINARAGEDDDDVEGDDNDEINRSEIKSEGKDSVGGKDDANKPDFGGVKHTYEEIQANTQVYNNTQYNEKYNDNRYINHSLYKNDTNRYKANSMCGITMEKMRNCKITLRHNKRSYSKLTNGNVVKNTKWLDVISTRYLLKITAVNMITWFVANTLYYGLTLKMGDLNGNRYLNVSFAGLVEIPACLLTLFCMDKYGRRGTFTYALLLSGCLTSAISFISPATSYVSVGLALISKTTVAMGVCVCWMHATEMYPTNIRNKAISICSMCGRFGGVCAPMILALGRATHGRDFLIFGMSSILAGILSFHLPETLNRNLPETIDDLTYFVT